MNIEQINAGSALLMDALWRATWQGTLAAFLVWVVCSALPKISPRARSWLWRLVFLKFAFTLLWFAPLELPVFRATLPVQTSALTPNIISARVPGPSAKSSAPNSPPQSSAQTVSQPIPVPAVFAWQSLLSALWLSGVSLAASRLLWQFVQARKLRRKAAPCTNPNLTSALIELSRKLSLQSAPQLFSSDATARPLLIGIRKPMIILPRQIVAHSSTSSIEMMIAHELAHVRRGDLAWTLATALIQALFFFNPAVWFARREYVLSQEIACDELAITAISREDHTVSAYAEMLLQIVATPATRASVTHFTLGVADAKRTLERRIRSMNLIHEKRTKVVRILAATAIVSLVVLQVPVRLVSAADDNPGDNSPSAQPGRETPVTNQINSPTLDNTTVIGEIVLPTQGNEGPPNDPISVTARRGGMIEKVLVKVGDRVAAGQPLLEMDSSEAKVQLRTAQARLRVAEADLEIARAEFNQVTNEYEVKRKMLETGRLSADELPNIERSRGMLKKSEAMLAVAKSEVELAELTLSQFTVRAPADGIIWSIAAPGTWVPQEGGKLLAQIKNPDRERAASGRKVIALQERLKRLQQEQIDLLKQTTESHPRVSDIKSQIRQTEASIREHREFQNAIK